MVVWPAFRTQGHINMRVNARGQTGYFRVVLVVAVSVTYVGPRRLTQSPDKDNGIVGRESLPARAMSSKLWATGGGVKPLRATGSGEGKPRANNTVEA